MASFIVMVAINSRMASFTAAACLPRSWRVVKRGQGPDSRVERGRAVDDRDPGANRWHAVFAGDHGDAGHGLADRVVADLVAIRTELPVRGNVDHDDARVEGFEHVIAKAHLVDRPGAEVLHDDVGDLDQLAQGCLPFVLAQVHAHALLAAVVLDPVRALLADPWRVVPGFLAAQALDLDDFSAQTSQHLSAAGSCLMATQIDYADTVQRPFAIGHCVAPWKTITSRPRVPPADILRCASAARSGGKVSATRRVRRPSATRWPSRSSAFWLCTYDATRTGSIVIPRSDGPAKPRTVASLPPSRIAGRAAASSTAASISPSTPPGAASWRPRTAASPRGTTVSAPNRFTSASSCGPATAIT